MSDLYPKGKMHNITGRFCGKMTTSFLTTCEKGASIKFHPISRRYHSLPRTIYLSRYLTDNFFYYQSHYKKKGLQR
jgi:hypothetical protein